MSRIDKELIDNAFDWWFDDARTDEDRARLLTKYYQGAESHVGPSAIVNIYESEA